MSSKKVQHLLWALHFSLHYFLIQISIQHEKFQYFNPPNNVPHQQLIAQRHNASSTFIKQNQGNLCTMVRPHVRGRKRGRSKQRQSNDVSLEEGKGYKMMFSLGCGVFLVGTDT
jgi:hypothetical protein